MINKQSFPTDIITTQLSIQFTIFVYVALELITIFILILIKLFSTLTIATQEY